MRASGQTMSTANDERILQTAHSLRRSGKLREAADLYRTLVTKDPDNVHALHFLGVAEAGSGDFAQAKIHIARSLSITPPNIQFIENYATILFQAGDVQSAVDLCQKGLNLNAISATLLYVSALSYFRLGKFPESLAQFNRLLELQPNHVAALNERAAVLGTLKQYDAALLSVETAIALDPRYAEAHLNKAILCSQVRRYGDTAAAYGKALALRPSLVDAWLGHGDACFALQRFDDALAEKVSFFRYGGSSTIRCVRNSDNRPTGRLIKKIQCQLKLSVIHPPSVGPIAGASTTAMP